MSSRPGKELHMKQLLTLLALTAAALALAATASATNHKR
jgi:hypothetical protein